MCLLSMVDCNRRPCAARVPWNTEHNASRMSLHMVHAPWPRQASASVRHTTLRDHRAFANRDVLCDRLSTLQTAPFSVMHSSLAATGSSGASSRCTAGGSISPIACAYHPVFARLPMAMPCLRSLAINKLGKGKICM